jgi:calcineurin-like phosphoesterase family protein
MSRHLVSQINKYVGQDDILFHLGDWSFSGIENIWNFRKQLICKNIHFIIGNHDNAIKKNLILPNCKRDNPYSVQIIEGKPISGEYPDYVEAQYLFESTQHYLEIQVDKQLICMMHYPIESWNNKGRGAIMLHGHSHHRLDFDVLNQEYKRMDVGIDNNEFKPYSFKEIMEIMSKRNN